MNLYVYCQGIGYSRGVERTREDAHSWLCVDSNGGFHPFDMADVCPDSHPYVSLGSDSDSGSWACNTQSQSAPVNGTWTYSGGQSQSGGNQPNSGSQSQATNSFGSGSLQLDGGSDSPPSPPYLQVVTGQLNVRNGPGISNAVIGKARQNGYYQIVGGPSSGWYQIAYNGGTGWVSGGSAYVSVTLNQASPGNTAQTTTPTGGSNNGNMVIWAPTTECPTTSTNLWFCGSTGSVN